MISVQNISIAFKDFHVLRNVSVDFKSGEFTCILGPNGAGKSTLLKAASGWLKASKGSITYNGECINKRRVSELSKHRAFLSQKLNSNTDIRVEELVMMGRYTYFKNKPSDEDLQIVQKAMVQFGVEKMAKRSLGILSGGEQQRVHLARVIAQINNQEEHSKFLLLDEPVNNLDIKYQHMILRQGQLLASEGIGVICVLHDLNLAFNYADRILLMKNGNIELDTRDVSSISKEKLEEIYEVSYDKINLSQKLELA